MENIIHLLSDEVSALIAAGEVVERPVSVVKELVENSIDAGAKKISVEIENSGLKLIRVIDNGTGMTRKDAQLSFVKHATSKISTKDDLFAIATLGFRGEALASISAVSHFELITKTRESTEGTKITVDGSKISDPDDVAAPDGTSVSVKNLFYNTPARLKFIKSEQTETGLISTLIERLALSHPDISFSLMVNGRQSVFTDGNGKLYDAVFSVFGREFCDMTLPVAYSGEISVNGFIGKPLYSKPNRNYQIFFVNGRLVRSKALQSALEYSYKNSMLISRYPVCVLFVEINSSDIDINVHPSKQEIKFSDETLVKNALLKAIKSAVEQDSGIVPIIPEEQESKIPVKPAVQEKPVEYSDWSIEPPEIKTASDINAIADLSETSVQLPVEAPQPSQVVDHFANKPVFEQEKIENKVDWRLVGEVFSSFVIIQKDDNVLFIDKHALHERINYENLKTRKPQSQYLLTPITVTLGAGEHSKILENTKTLETLGFEIEDFGATTVLVRKIPQLLSVSDVEYLLNKFADGVCSAKSTYDEFLYDIACKASIKSGMHSSDYELTKLIDEYLSRETELKYCPHGRPVCFSLSKTALEKQFKRIV